MGNTARWTRRRLQALRAEFGGRCHLCLKADTELEFSHLAPTGLSGMGRGRYERLYDILRYPFNYWLLCVPCHREFDRK